MVIRIADESDSGRLAELERDIFRDPWSCQGIKDTFAQQNTLILAGEEDGRIEGYVILYCVLDEGEIARIAVSDFARRKGAASSLLKQAKEECLKNGIKRLLLDVRSSNDAALSLYRKQGFVVDGIRKGFYQNPLDDAILMSLELS